MRLTKIFVENFKGLDKLNIEPNGKNVVLRGKNGTGKTTVADAYAWCVTGKGFDGKTIDTQIKKRAADGSTPNDGGVEHAVEVEYEVDENHYITLRREFKEKWEKHRGQAESEFRGHTSTYAVDGVPMSKKEYERRVADLMKGDTFQLLSMPLHFCTATKWQDRRKTLVKMCGDVTDESIIDGNPELKPLKALLDGKSISDLRKVLQSKLKKTNDETKTIPARIDELNGMMPEDAGQQRETIEAELDSLTKQQDEKRAELVRIKNGGEIAEKQKALAEVESRLGRMKADYDAELKHKAREAAEAEYGIRSEIERLGSDIERDQKRIAQYKQFAATQDKLAADLRAEWGAVHAQEFFGEVSDTCPYCGQQLPAEKLEEVTAKAVEDFNIKKAQRLKEINAEGKCIVEKKTQDLNDAAELEVKNAARQARIEELSAKLKDSAPAEAVPDIEKQPEYIELSGQRKALSAEIDALREQTAPQCEKVSTEISALALDIRARQEKLSAIKQAESIKARIEELKGRETELGQIYAQLQSQLYLTEEFLRAKVRATEDSINSHFKYVRWKMFEQRINGALEECCEPLIDGVPFSDGLNKGNKMKAALDIVNALSKYYGISLPVIIDDCESYTSLPDVDAQVIKLIADGEHDSLDVEIED